MTGKHVSRQQVQVVEVLRTEPEQWLGSTTVATKAGISPNTVRHFLVTLFRFGILERREYHPVFLYRLSPTAWEHPYFLRLQEAATVMFPGDQS